MGKKTNNTAGGVKANTAKTSVVLNNNTVEGVNNEKKVPTEKPNEIRGNKNMTINGTVKKGNDTKPSEKRISVNMGGCGNSNNADGFVMVTPKKKTSRKGSNREDFNDYSIGSRNMRSNNSINSRTANNSNRNNNMQNARSSDEGKMMGKGRVGNRREEKIEEVTPELKKELKAYEDERKKIEHDINKKIGKLKSVSQIENAVNRIEAERKQKEEILGIISTITSAISRANAHAPKPVSTKTPSAELEVKIKDAKLLKKSINSKKTSDIEDANTYINYLEGQLFLVKNCENVKSFQSRLNNLKRTCEERLRANEKLVSDAKHQERKLKSVEKIISMKKKTQGVDVNEKNIVKKDHNLNTEHYNSLIKPHNFINRIQSKYIVSIEKNNASNAHDKVCLNITGCEEDVDAVITFLKNIDFNEKNIIRLNYEIVKGMLNAYEGNFKKLEAELNVFVQRENDTVTFCGMKNDTQKFRELIEKTKVLIEKNTNKSISKEIILNSDLARGFHKGLLKDIEKKTNTTIKINYNEQKNEASAIIKGYKNTDIEEAEEELNEIFKGLKVHFIALDENALTALYRRCKYELNDMRKNLNLFILRRDDGISLIGKAENVEEGLEILDKTRAVFMNRTVKKMLTEEEAFLFNANFKNQIKLETGATVKIFNKHDHKEMHISGSDEQISMANEKIEDLLMKKKCVEVEINEKVIALLLSAKAQKIKEIETNTCTSIQINKNNFTAKIYGQEEKIRQAKDILTDLVTNEKRESNGSAKAEVYEEVAEMTVESEDIGSIIGRRGQMINKIQNDSGVKKIHVDKENRKVYIYGSASAVQSAKEKILDAIAKGKNQEFHTTDRYQRGPKNSGTPGGFKRNLRRNSGNKTGRSSVKTQEPVRNGVVINTSDEEAFPSLHDVTNVTTKKGKKPA